MNLLSLKSIISAILLTSAAFLAGKSNAKEGRVYSLYVTNNGVCVYLGYMAYSPFFTTGGLGLQMTISSSSVGRYFSVYATSNCSPSSVVHFTL